MAGSQLETDGLNEFAVLWPAQPLAAVDNEGRVRIGVAVEIPAKWNIGSRLNQAADNESKVVSAVVKVDRKIPVGSILWEGKLEDLPNVLSDLYEVIEYTQVSDIKCRNKLHTVVVSSFRDEMPSSV